MEQSWTMVESKETRRLVFKLILPQMKRVATSTAIFGGSAAVVVTLILYHLEFEEIGLYVRAFLLPLLFTTLPYLYALPLLEKTRWRFDQKGVRIKGSGRKSQLPWLELKAYSISTTDELLDHAHIRLFTATISRPHFIFIKTTHR